MNDNLSTFIKNDYKYNKVKELKDAFEEYPVEDEWHEGKIEKMVNDANEEYDNSNIF